MEILECPKCKLSNGALYFKSKRARGKSYPKVKHYKPSKKSRESWCNISVPNLSKIEFRDPKLNAWKSVLDDPMDWHKIPGLASRYSSTDSYIRRSDIENIHEEFLNIMDREATWLKKCSVPGKEPIAFTHYEHIAHMPKTPSTILDLLKLTKEMEVLEKNNDDPEKVLYLRLFHNVIIHAHNMAFTVRNRLIRHVPLEEGTIKIGRKKRIITSKQKLKILKRQTKEVLPLFEPQDRDEALASHFYGIQCPNEKCRKEHRSWRTDLSTDGIGSKYMCHACGTTWFESGIRPDCRQCHGLFYDSAVREMIKTAVDDGDRILTCCIYCKEEVSFQKKHIEKFSDVLLI